MQAGKKAGSGQARRDGNGVLSECRRRTQAKATAEDRRKNEKVIRNADETAWHTAKESARQTS